MLRLARLTLYTSQPFISVPGTVRGGGGGSDGEAVQSLTATSDPGVVGIRFDFQWVVADPGIPASLPIALSDALPVTFGF